MAAVLSAAFHFISIHAAREGGDGREIRLLGANDISIHAAREGGDGTEQHFVRPYIISIHAAREGGDQHREDRAARLHHFNPRRP